MYKYIHPSIHKYQNIRNNLKVSPSFKNKINVYAIKWKIMKSLENYSVALIAGVLLHKGDKLGWCTYSICT